MTGRRRAGLLVPLFSCPSTASWGIGDIGDIEPLTRWLAGAGLRVLQLLPINEMAPAQQSPYSAISAMAIDPVFIRVPDIPDYEPSSDDRIRDVPRIDYGEVRRVKHAALRRAFDRFYATEVKRDGDRARQLRAFVCEQAWWIEDYSLFRAIHAHEGERPWMEWPRELQLREPAAIDRARRELARDVLLYQYLQWIATMQWKRARERSHGVQLFGDLPFMVDADSADVWSRQHQFSLDVTIGAPPDAFSATGQDWGTPLYRWDVIAREDFRWLRERARRSADLFDGYRIDHLVGFYRTYGNPKDGRRPFFTPQDEPSQRALGERVMATFREPGSEIIAEDLGTVPDFVRESLARLEIPGFRVLRWERHWHTDGQPFREPGEYPAVSVATSGTHDTETLAAWWDHASADERGKVASLSTIRRMANGVDVTTAPFDPQVRDVLLRALFASGSDLLLLPVQDVFGWRDRINEPATIGDGNWTYRLPWPSDRLDEIDEARAAQRRLRAWAEQFGRT
jgi:4-alpha-glucanotransferase